MMPWRSVSGPAALARAIGRYPDHLQAFSYLIARNGVGVNQAAGQTGRISSIIQGNAITQELDIDSDSDFWCLSTSMAIQFFTGTPRTGFGALFAHSTGSWWAHVDPREESGGSALSDQPIAVGAVFGDGGDRPHVLPCPWILRSGARIVMRLVSNSDVGVGTGSTIIYPTLHGFKRMLSGPDLPLDVFLEPRLLDSFRQARLDAKLARIEPVFYSMLFNFTPDAFAPPDEALPMLTLQRTITAADGDVFLCNLYGQVFNDIGAPGVIGTSVPPVVAGTSPHISDAHLVRLVVDEGLRRIDDRPIPLRSLFGYGARWGKIPKPIHLRAGQTMTATLSPQSRAIGGSGGGSWRAMLSFAGVKVYPQETRR
jgi:hypothetical protein